jgi:hypothetical protein
MALADYQSLIVTLVDDPSKITTEADCDKAIDLAVARYSQDKPLVRKFDVTAAGGPLVALPPEFVDGVSAVFGVELFGGDRPYELDNEDWEAYLGTTGWQLLFDRVIGAGEIVRVQISLPHTLDAGEDTIPAQDREAVANWASSVLLQKLATSFSGNRQSTFLGDSVDHGAKAVNFASRSKKSRDLYFELLGIKRDRVTAAGVVVDWDGRNSLGGDHLTHGRRRR